MPQPERRLMVLFNPSVIKPELLIRSILVINGVNKVIEEKPSSGLV